ncbi:OmpH family outer membrane protein [Flavobacterium sp. IMCC34852]|uniref:OmpH family outer membrane protein n=1 Tax=Flavobacterium rivulicola TaxID=2732161 RepID=A0A7Y3VYV2_9FLAO|nr:OmpH family outer membrane protein [Flavobacterium sp. IMCC34852]NNT71821.1 OmpH family outer membrane protein [Flavobacterium sp. IMCC34852]
MKKYFAISILLLSLVFEAKAQSRGVKIGYIDMEYILQNVPDYTEANNQLEQKAQKWKQDIETKKIEIAKLKDALKTEKALLTKELIEEREEEIKFQEDELLDFQQKKFGPNGDLMTQKAVLVKPIQDQVFNAVQDIAELKKYDFIFDKSSDLTMLFSAKRHDISDQVVRSITRAERREQLSKKELKEQEKKEYMEDVEDENPALAARKKALEEKKAARDKLMEDRKLAAEAKKKEQDDKRKAAAEAREAKKSGTVPANDKTTSDKTVAPETNKKTSDSTTVDPNSKEAKAAARAKLVEDKKKALEEKKKKILADREAAKKTKEEKTGEPKKEE